MAKGGMCGKGGMHGEGGVCGEGGHAWQGGVCATHSPGHHEIQSINARPVRILLECILVVK